MLSIKNLVKVYKTKGGTEVRALDGVNVDFPEKGMVFLLGKSGSGKSTLLNVAGGLDRPDSGEIIVKGKSSKSFSAADFDSYRNTFIGFVFQEYNILEEFNIEQNIALALQLQGKKNDKAAVENLLKQVDLEGLGKRKPNTLSGGQKQRVAIARALIKEPEIIMADEPTGALDSNTGKQVFDTLKRLSADKLVLIVSHDREFAEQYADRIIELKDGKILSDTSKTHAPSERISENVNAIGSDTVRVKDWDKLTQEDFNRILGVMKGHSGEVIITSNEKDLPAVKRVCKISEDGNKDVFKDTDRSAVKVGQYDASKTKFIKSRMPAARAIKMGASGLKTKPIRLFFTIFISVLSFTLFGVLATMMMYDPIYSIAEALQTSPYTTATLSKNYRVENISYSVDSEGNRTEDYRYESQRSTMFGAEELKRLNDNSHGLKFAGAFDFSSSDYGEKNYSYQKNLQASANKDYYVVSSLYGFSDCGAEFMQSNDFTLVSGAYPVENNEIAVSNYVYEQFKEAGYDLNGSESTIENPTDLIGKTLSFNAKNGTVNLVISGIYNVGDLSKYNDLRESNSSLSPNDNEKKKQEFQEILQYGFHSLGYVAPGFYERYKNSFADAQGSYIDMTEIGGMALSNYKIDYELDENHIMHYYSPDIVKANASKFSIYSIDGEKKDAESIAVGEKEVYATAQSFSSFASELSNSSKSLYSYIDREGNRTESVEDIEEGWEYADYFYADGRGNISLTEIDGYAKVENGRGYVSADGQYSKDPRAGWQFIKGVCYVDENGKVHLTQDNEEWIKKNQYYKNSKGDLIIDPMAGWTYHDGYVASGADGKTLMNGDKYYEFNYFYADEAGNLYLENGEGRTQHWGFHIDKEGNASLEGTDSSYVTGFWMNPEGEISLTKKDDGYIFTDSYCKKNGIGSTEIVLGERYTGIYTKGTDVTCDPAYNFTVRSITKAYREEYPEFVEALKRFDSSFGNGPNAGEDEIIGECTDDDIKLILTSMSRDYSTWVGTEQSYTNAYAKNFRGQEETLKVVGIYTGVSGSYYIMSEDFAKSFGVKLYRHTWITVEKTDYVEPADAKYNYAVSLTNNTLAQSHFMLDDRDNSVFYSMNNAVYSQVSSMAYMLETMKLVFLIVGAVMAGLSALLLFNFISVSISSKRKEIGILRAVGARGSDVFKIFFAEAFIIALICFVISAVAGGIACFVINGIFATSAFAISVLNYGVIEVLLIFGISLVVAVVATILPVFFAAKKPPVESIRAL